MKFPVVIVFNRAESTEVRLVNDQSEYTALIIHIRDSASMYQLFELTLTVTKTIEWKESK